MIQYIHAPITHRDYDVVVIVIIIIIIIII